eukprot:4906391-Prorocentrum_lima.AAC.1
MSRQSLAQVIHREFPELGGLISHLLVPIHKAYWQRRPLSMAIGVHQGCPFSMGIFSDIEQFPNAVVTAYADDII